MNLPKSLLVTGGRLIDPANGFDGPADLLILEGKIAAAGPGRRHPGPAGDAPLCRRWLRSFAPA